MVLCKLSAGFAPGQDEVKPVSKLPCVPACCKRCTENLGHRHAFCLLLLTSMSKGVDGGTQCNHVRLNTMPQMRPKASLSSGVWPKSWTALTMIYDDSRCLRGSRDGQLSMPCQALAHERHDLLGCHRVLFFRVCGDHLSRHADQRSSCDQSGRQSYFSSAELPH